MKKQYPLVGVLLIFVLLVFVNASAKDIPDGKDRHFKLQIYVDGKPTDHYIVGTLIIHYDNDRKPQILWDHVKISPLHAQQAVLLYPEHRYSADDDFEAVIISENHFSFAMRLAPDAKMIISGTFAPFSIKGVYKDTEWVQVGKIILPYREIYP